MVLARSPQKRKPKRRAATSKGPADSKAPRKTKPCIVGIGASAGGYEALRELFSTMSAASGLAFVVIQHLDPTRKSLGAELLGRNTPIPVVQAEDGGRVQGDHVYTIPPNTMLSIEKCRFRLTPPGEPRERRFPIDFFFKSLAADQCEKAIGIILSGAGSDGALGLEAIAAHGGMTLAQDPATAQFDSMPRSAIATGLVNHTLAPRKMGEVLVAYARHPYARSRDPIRDGRESEPALLREILERVHARSGYDFTGYKNSMLLRRVHRRMGLLRIGKFTDYVALLRSTPKEVDALFKDFLIGVTDFFRDPEAWALLETKVVEPIVARKGNTEPIRVWCAGAATGEEAYSLGMLFLESIERAGKRCPVNVFTTDTNEDALAFARAGVYPAGIAERLSPARLRRFFIEDKNAHRFRVSKALRDVVVFGTQNLFRDPPFSKMDLVSCRNLLIYLDADLQQQAIQLFHFALRPEGYLFLGSTESVGRHDDLFVAVSRKWRIYRRTGTTPRERLGRHLKPGERSAGVSTHSPRRSVPGMGTAALAQRLILERFAPAAVLFDSRFQALHFCGPTERFLKQPRGAPTQDVLTLARDGLRAQLRSGARKAYASQSTAVMDSARVKNGNTFVPVRLTVIPAGEVDGEMLMLAVFEDLPPSSRGRRTGSGTSADTQVVKRLEEELQAAKEDLRISIERLATSNEELTGANEEVSSRNEELQTLNEELEGSKEELQSLNEELTTVNQELQTKLATVEAAGNDLRNLLASSDIATLCLDPEGRIKWFSPAARAALGISQSDIGRPIRELHSPLLGSTLAADQEEVLQRLRTKRTELETESGACWLRRTLPYRLADESVAGVVVTFTEITESKSAERQLAATAALTRTLEQRVNERTAQLRKLMLELSMAEDRERRAIALDLHDHLGQLLAVANVKLAALRSDSTPSASALAEVAELVTQAERAVRSLGFQISPPVLYELGLAPALEWLADEMRRVYGINVAVRDDGKSKPLDKTIRSNLFRAVRELLINVSKHANAGEAEVDITSDAERVTIRVSDAGVGFTPGSPQGTLPGVGFGLPSVRERLTAIGGSFEINAVPGNGTVAVLTAPFTLAAA